MYFSFYIAKRYLLSKKSVNVINIISAITFGGVFIGAMVFIVILSVFNGIDGLVKSLFNSFDPDIKITAVKGKVFDADTSNFEKVKQLKGVACFSSVLEENALFQNGEYQKLGVIKGVSDNYADLSGVDSMLLQGEFKLKNKQEYLAVIGLGVASSLSTGIGFVRPLKVWLPRRSAKVSTLDFDAAFNQGNIYLSAIFSIQTEYDENYMLVPIEFARKLLEYEKEVSSIEIKLEDNLSEKEQEKVRLQIAEIMGNDFNVKNRYQQKEFFYKVMQSEKWVIFFILSFVIIIISFNAVASVSMLIIEKKKDIAILIGMGANMKTIKHIFLVEGWLISVLGTVFGLALGFILCFLQQKTGLLKFPVSSDLLRSYPVEMRIVDFNAVFFIVAGIGFLASWFPARFITRRYSLRNDNLSELL